MSVAGGSGNARPIWLCADDYGISPGVSKGIRDLVAQGRLNATSVMVVAPSFDRAEAGLAEDAQRRRAPGRDRAARDADRKVQADEPRISARRARHISSRWPR